MNQDILFPTPDFVFSLRVGAILRCGDKLLLQRAAGEYAAIGGHVAGMEAAAETLRREFREELHVEITVGDLSCVCENFFQYAGRSWHQIYFFYHVHLTAPTYLPADGTFHGFDDHGRARMDLDYRWVPLSEIRRGLPIYPAKLVPYLLGTAPEPGCFLQEDEQA